MCILCAPAQTVDTCPTLATGLSSARVVEIADAASAASTVYQMAIGDSFEGSLTSGDRDWVAVTLQAGETYTFDMMGAPSGAGTLADSYLRLYSATGTELAFNDDGGTGYDSRLSYQANSGGTYYIAAGSYGDAGAGSYVLSAGERAGSAVGTLDAMAEYLTDGFWGGSGFQFDTSTSNRITVDLTGLTAGGAQLARWAMQAWEAVANLDFIEVTSGAQMTFDDDQSGAFAGPDRVIGGYTQTASVNVSTGWLSSYGTQIDSYSFQTYVHEIGHALGLGHQGGYNGSATYGTDETFANDSWQLSVMSYFSQSENDLVNASRALIGTAMMVDIVAIQSLYGVSTTTAGNTIWGQGSTLGTYLDDLMDAFAGGNGNGNVDARGRAAFTIFDHSGTDTLDLSFTTAASRVDMRAESFSDVGGLIGNVAIARDTVIENAYLGSGNDVITGNSAGNLIQAGDGNDEVWALRGDDTVFGGAGDDTVGGAAGNDVINGEAGNDVLWGSNGRDTLSGGADDDILGGGASDDFLDGGTGNDSLYGGTGQDRIIGGSGDDEINGWAHVDDISGGTGNDFIIGGNWGDTIYGDDGDDLIFGDGDTRVPNNYAGNDVIFGGNGHDTIMGARGADTIHGESGNDVIWGGDGWNRLDGGDGNDKLMGGRQPDRLSGGDGVDRLTGGASADTFVFAVGFGTDTITDFTVSDRDRLELDDALWLANHGTLSRLDIIDRFAVFDTAGVVAMVFDDGDRITLNGVTSMDGLSGALIIA